MDINKVIKSKKVIAGILGLVVLFFIFSSFFTVGGVSSVETVNNAVSIGKNGFTANITCTIQGSQGPLLACYERTDLKVRTGNFSKIYSGMEIAQMGGQIDLPQHFELVTQNSHDSFLLNVSIIDNSTNQELFRDSASRYGVISVAN